jgi:predicted HicB family RNase H-like nuclease
MERLEIKLSKELKDKIKREAQKLEISVSAYIRMKLNS